MQYNKLPESMRWSRLSYGIPDSIENELKNLSLIEGLKKIFSDFENISFAQVKNSFGPFYQTSPLLIPDRNNNLLHDKKPELIIYTDTELIKIYVLFKAKKIPEIAVKINCLTKEVNNKKSSTQNDFLILEKYLENVELTKRKEIILNSITYAISGDLCTALHLIAPQVEEFFRIIIRSLHIKTSVFTNENNFEEISISQIFQNKQTAEILINEYGHDVFCGFYLTFLDKRCGNYRNKMFHGQMEFSDFTSNEAVYAWALCMYAIFKKLPDTPTSPPDIKTAE
jgi:hypothetical protein